MRYILVVLAIIMLTPSLALGQATSPSRSCEQTAKELEARITKITQELDSAAFEQFVADDVVIIRADGETTTKKQQATTFRGASNLVISFRSTDIKIRICSETTIVTTGKDIVKAREKGSNENDTQDYYWFTRIYEKRRAKWFLVFNQLTSANE